MSSYKKNQSEEINYNTKEVEIKTKFLIVCEDWWWCGYVSASQSKGWMFEAHHDPWLLLEGEATLPVLKKTGSPWWAVQLVSYVSPFPRG